MKFNPITGGITPLEARATTGFYSWLTIPIFFILVATLIFVIYTIRKRIRSSPQWIETQKKRLTNYKDIIEVAKKIALSKYETSLLWEICHKNKAKNINYLIYDIAAIDKLFKTQYLKMLAENESAKKITQLFLLRYKIELQDMIDTRVTKTQAIPDGTKIIFIFKPEIQIQCTLKKNTQENIVISIPETLYNSNDRPAALDKCFFVFTTKSGMTYKFQTRIIRYSIGFDDGTEMIIAHTNDLQAQTKRKSKRSDVNSPCVFCVANAPLTDETKNNGILANISADGCCIVTSLNIKENQHIRIFISFKNDQYEVTGLILSSKKNFESNTFKLSILFTEITDDTRNKILAYIYGYIQ